MARDGHESPSENVIHGDGGKGKGQQMWQYGLNGDCILLRSLYHHCMILGTPPRRIYECFEVSEKTRE